MKLEIRNLKLVVQIFCSFKFPVSSFRRVLQGIFSKTCSVVHCPRDAEVSVVFVDNRKMRQLNRKYRGKDKTANVLAFPVDPHPAYGHPLPQGEGRVRDLGDIFICLPEAKREAKKYEWTMNYAIARLALHGFLHLLGYDHVKEKEARRMERIEERVLSNF